MPLCPVSTNLKRAPHSIRPVNATDNQQALELVENSVENTLIDWIGAELIVIR